MKESGKMIKQMAMERILKRMEILIPVIGLMINRTEKEKRYSLMVQHIKDIILTE